MTVTSRPSISAWAPSSSSSRVALGPTRRLSHSAMPSASLGPAKSPLSLGPDPPTPPVPAARTGVLFRVCAVPVTEELERGVLRHGKLLGQLHLGGPVYLGQPGFGGLCRQQGSGLAVFRGQCLAVPTPWGIWRIGS